MLRLYKLSEDPDRRLFYDRLIEILKEEGIPISKRCPTISRQPLDLYRLYLAVKERGGFEVMRGEMWQEISDTLGIRAYTGSALVLRKQYIKHLLPFEYTFDRGGIVPDTLVRSFESKSRKENAINARVTSVAQSMSSSVPPVVTASSSSVPNMTQSQQVGKTVLDPPVMDESNQASNALSSLPEEQMNNNHSGPTVSYPPMPSTLPSPDLESISSCQDESESDSNPSWPRTSASSVIDNQMNDHPPIKRPNGMLKLYDLTDDPDRRFFLDKLIRCNEERGTHLSQCPRISKQPLDLYRLYLAVKERGGFVRVMRGKMWKEITGLIGMGASSGAAYALRKQYEKHLLPFECKLDSGGIDYGMVKCMAWENAGIMSTSVAHSITSPVPPATTVSSSSVPSMMQSQQVRNAVLNTPLPPIVDEGSQASNASSSLPEEQMETSGPTMSYPPMPNTLPSQGAASVSSFHNESGSVSNPSWPRTSASPHPDGMFKLYNLSEDPDRRTFLDKLIKYHEEMGTPLSQCPTINEQPLDLYLLYLAVKEGGGVYKVVKRRMWDKIADLIGIGTSSGVLYTMVQQYIRHLLPFECKFDRGSIDPEPLVRIVESDLLKASSVNAGVSSSASIQSESKIGKKVAHNKGGPSKQPLDEKGQKSSDECIICCEESVNCAFSPCGHFNCCFNCALKLFKSKSCCPICRKPIKSILKIYK